MSVLPEIMKDPTTPQEWQAAVNLAQFYSLLHSAKAYRLVTGGPEINIDRCDDMLKRGKALGYEPHENLLPKGSSLK